MKIFFLFFINRLRKDLASLKIFAFNKLVLFNLEKSLLKFEYFIMLPLIFASLKIFSNKVSLGKPEYFSYRDLRQNIKGILGTKNNFSKGNSHFEFIENNTGYKRERFLFIGDDLYDYELSMNAEVDFILINRKLKKFSISNIFEINSFNELEGLINGKI